MRRGAREPVSSLESRRSTRAAGRRRDPRPRAESGRSGVLRRHVHSLVVSRRLGVLFKKSHENVSSRVSEGKLRARARAGPFPGRRVGPAARLRRSAGVLGGGRFESRPAHSGLRSLDGASSLPGLGVLICEVGSFFRPM